MTEPRAPVGISRRRFLRDAGVASIAATDALTGRAVAAHGRRRRRRRLKVAVFGGGIAGLTAAHELVDRGFLVTVYDRQGWGGKAKGTRMPGSAAGGRQPLPGEHGVRTFFGFYQNLPDTMRRIPFGSNPNGVLDNLVAEPVLALGRNGGRRDIVLPLGATPEPRSYTPGQVVDAVIGLLEAQLPPHAVAHFAGRVAVYLSSCDARRLGQWERTPWTDFIASHRYGGDYHRILGRIPELFVGAKPERASTKFVGWILESAIHSQFGFGSKGPTFRVLNGPTSEALFDPWLATLVRGGAHLRDRHELTGFELHGCRIAGARVRSPHGTSTVRADWYVCALPVERARRLWTSTMLAADPQLRRMFKLETALGTGIQFYLRKRTPILRGIYFCVDSPWLVQGVAQSQFWSHDFASTYGDGRAHDCLSLALTNWTAPGVVYGKPVEGLTAEQCARDVWEQIKRHVNKPGQPPVLTDDLLVSWQLGDGVVQRHGYLVDEVPLITPMAGTEQFRPQADTAIANLALAGDYLATPWEVINMETANYSGRWAANVILDRSGSTDSPAKTVGTYRPPEWEPFKRIDEDRYKRRQPNMFDADLTPDALKLLLQAVA